MAFDADAKVVETAVVGFGEVTEGGNIELARTVAALAVLGRRTDVVLLLVSSVRSVRDKSVSDGNVLSGGGIASVCVLR